MQEHIGKGKVTLVIIFINVCLFIAINVIPGFGENLLLNPDISKVLEKPWTLVTVFFSHKLVFHIILNMALLFFFGLELEKLTNGKTVIIVYLIAGLLGSLAFLFTGLMIVGTGVAAGASAAVMGVVATFSVIRPDAIIFKSKAKLWVGALLIFSVLSVVINPQTLDSGVAHVSGVFIGFVCGFYLKKINNQRF